MIDHRANGRKYGYPSCCVDQFVREAGTDQAQRRGVIDLGQRPNGDQLRYVPCDACIGSTYWRPFNT